MKMQQLVDDLKNKIITELNLAEIDPAKIKNDDPLFGEGLGLDSIDALEIVVILERDYGIEIEEIESMSPHFRSLDTLATYVDANRKSIAV